MWGISTAGEGGQPSPDRFPRDIYMLVGVGLKVKQLKVVADGVVDQFVCVRADHGAQKLSLLGRA